jgi:hypothetical protein
MLVNAQSFAVVEMTGCYALIQHTKTSNEYFWTALGCPLNQVLLSPIHPPTHSPNPAQWLADNFQHYIS